MIYHVIVETADGDEEVRVGLDHSELNERFLEPYYWGRPIVIGGRTLAIDDVRRMTIYESREELTDLASRAREEHQQALTEGVLDLTYSEDHAIARMGEDVTDRVITTPPGKGQNAAAAGEPHAEAKPPDPQQVFVVHGRNSRARSAMFAFLRSIGLRPIEWSEARQTTNIPTPYVGEILDTAFAMAAAVVVLMTPDDLASLDPAFLKPGDPEHERTPTGQARPNVLFEAGMAMGRDAGRTVLVELGHLRPFSDIGGRHVMRMSDASQDRQELANRLLSAGAAVSLTGTDWHTAGEFEAVLSPLPPSA